MEFNHVRQLAAQQRTALLRCFRRVVERGVFLDGPEVKILENRLGEKFSSPYVLTVASGHDALLFALQALKLEKGAEVLCPVLAYPTAFPIVQAGYSLRGVDCDPNGQLSIEKIDQALTPNSKAIVLVHLYGLAGNIPEIVSYCRQKKLLIIEDCAQSFGTQIGTMYTGTFADFGCFSFYPTKNLSALGDGGAIICSKKDDFEYLKKIRKYGEVERYQSEFIAGHSRLPELQAAALSLYLDRFEKEAKKRRAIKKKYVSAIKKIGLSNVIRVLQNERDASAVPHLLVVEAKNRDQLQQFLKERDIPALVHYPLPVHQVGAFSPYFQHADTFPVAEHLAQNILSLPFSQFTTDAEICQVVEHIFQFYET